MTARSSSVRHRGAARGALAAVTADVQEDARTALRHGRRVVVHDHAPAIGLTDFAHLLRAVPVRRAHLPAVHDLVVDRGRGIVHALDALHHRQVGHLQPRRLCRGREAERAAEREHARRRTAVALGLLRPGHGRRRQRIPRRAVLADDNRTGRAHRPPRLPRRAALEAAQLAADVVPAGRDHQHHLPRRGQARRARRPAATPRPPRASWPRPPHMARTVRGSHAADCTGRGRSCARRTARRSHSLPLSDDDPRANWSFRSGTAPALETAARWRAQREDERDDRDWIGWSSGWASASRRCISGWKRWSGGRNSGSRRFA